jgi:hypothetical protein
MVSPNEIARCGTVLWGKIEGIYLARTFWIECRLLHILRDWESWTRPMPEKEKCFESWGGRLSYQQDFPKLPGGFRTGHLLSSSYSVDAVF